MLTSVLAIVVFTGACGNDQHLSTPSNVENEALEQVTFKANFVVYKYKKVVPIQEITDFSNGPRTEYKDVEQENLKDLMKTMKRNVDGDVGFYLHDFFNQSEIIDANEDELFAFLTSDSGDKFLDKFDLFIDMERDSATKATLAYSIMSTSVTSEEGITVKLLDILTGIQNTQNIDANILKIKDDQEFYENMILRLKEALIDFKKVK